MLFFLIGCLWLAVLGGVVAVCRTAARGDGRGSMGSPAEHALVSDAAASGLVVWEDPPDLDAELRGLQLKDPVSRGHGAQSAA
jgi:hypothetical protein